MSHCDVTYTKIRRCINIPDSINTKENKLVLPDTIQRFVKVPKEIILENTLTEHRISTYLYLNYNQTWNKMVHYSPIYMIQWCGYVPNWNRHKDRVNIYDKFLNCMQWYFENGYIIDFDRNKYSQSTFQSSLLNEDKFKPSNNFGVIYDFEVEVINNYQSSYKPLNKSILFLLLSYIRAFTWKRTNEISGHSEKSKKDKPEIFYSQFTTMATFIGVNRKMIAKATTVLEELCLIKTHRMPRYKDSNDNWHTDDIIYICPYKYESYRGQIYRCSKEEYNYVDELNYGIMYLREQKYISKKFYQD